MPKNDLKIMLTYHKGIMKCYLVILKIKQLSFIKIGCLVKSFEKNLNDLKKVWQYNIWESKKFLKFSFKHTKTKGWKIIKSKRRAFCKLKLSRLKLIKSIGLY